MSYRRGGGAKIHGKAVKKLHQRIMSPDNPDNPDAGPESNKLRKKARNRVLRRQGKRGPIV